MPGTLALVGGAEWRAGCDFDRELLELSGADEVLVLPTAAAYEHPDRIVEAAERWFGELGAKVRPLRVLTRPDAIDEANAAPIRDAALHLPVEGQPDAPALGAQGLAGVGRPRRRPGRAARCWPAPAPGGMVLCDPMVDPRGGAITLGLGLIAPIAVIPHHDTWSEDKAKRTLHIAPEGLPIAGIDERTALIRSPEGAWRVAGAGEVASSSTALPPTSAALP